ncbi:hypothetical protein KSF78_0006740 [Schistosoma japonicum]|nr:hypothetical protein KSF78_0006740 [Schistosoma japonicum]
MEVTQSGGDLPLDDQYSLAWVNEQLIEVKALPINSFRDSAISTGIRIHQLLEHIKPDSTNTSIWLEGDFSLCQ